MSKRYSVLRCHYLLRVHLSQDDGRMTGNVDNFFGVLLAAIFLSSSEEVK
jgi:hypothetical protein